MRPQEQANFIKAGAFFLILCLISSILVFVIGKKNNLFGSKSNLFVTVDHIENLKTGASVYLRGLKIGNVETVNFRNFDEILIEFAVDQNYLPLIKKDSFVLIKTQGVMGDKFLEILGGSRNSPSLSPGEQISFKRTPSMDDYIVKGEMVLTRAYEVLGGMKKVLDDLPTEKGVKVLHKMEVLLDDINYKNSLRKTVLNMSHLSQNLSDLSRQLKDGPGTFHSLLYDDTLYEDARAVIGGAKRSKILQYFVRQSVANFEREKEKERIEEVEGSHWRKRIE